MVESATCVHTIAAKDLMTIDVGEEIALGMKETYEGEWIPDTSP
jgi:hypothetical protein